MAEDKLEDDLAEVHTGNGYQADLMATQSHRIKLTVQGLKELRSLTGELIDGQLSSNKSIQELAKITKIQGEANEKLEKRVLWLTWVIVGLALIQAIAAIVTILLTVLLAHHS